MATQNNKALLAVLLILFFSKLVVIVIRDVSVFDNAIFPKLSYLTIIETLSFVSLSVYLFLKSRKEKKYILSFSYIDLIILTYLSYLLISFLFRRTAYYDNFLPLILGLCGTVLLAHLLRIESNAFKAQKIFSFIIVLASLGESTYSLLQFFGIYSSWNSHFPMTGSFPNPGPMAIWLAIALPLCLGILHRNIYGPLRILAITAIILSLITIILTQSRTAWTAVLFSTIYLYKQKIYSLRLSKYKQPIVIGLSLLFAYGCYQLYTFKRVSAIGRVIIWKISSEIFIDNPLGGVGLNGFPKAYGLYLAQYSSKKTDNPEELLLVENVNYAFNDFLQILIEQGIAGLLLFLSMLIAAFRPLRNDVRQSGLYIQSSLISLIVGCLFSYPLEITSIWMLFNLLLAFLSAEASPIKITLSSSYLVSFLLPITLVGLYIIHFQLKIYDAKRTAFKAYENLNNGNIRKSIILFEHVHPLLRYDYSMMLPFAKALSENKEYSRSNVIINEAKNTICTPFLYISEGNNYKNMKEYNHAIASYSYAALLEPKLLYPKFLLAKTYLEAKDTFRASITAQQVLNMEVKIVSRATNQMQAEMIYISELKKRD